MFDEKYRYLNPPLTDRINHLIDKLKGVVVSPPLLDGKLTNNKYRELLESYEIKLLKKNRFNFIVRNIPLTAIQASNGEKIKVTYVALRDTFNQFGEVKKLEICRGSAYVAFKNNKQAVETHALLNNMQLGENIIKTNFINKIIIKNGKLYF